MFPSINHHTQFRVLTLFTPIILGVLTGIQWLTSVLLIFGLHPRQQPINELTDVGKYWFRPEYDIIIYVVGCAFILALVFCLSLVMNKQTSRYPGRPSRATLIGLISLGVLSFLFHGMLLFFLKNQVLDLWKQIIPYGVKVALTFLWSIVLITPGTIALYTAVINLTYPIKLSTRSKHWMQRVSSALTKSLDVVVIGLIFAIVYVPNWSNLAGKIFLTDQFLHWDGFVVRVALSLRHMVSGRDIFVQYGIGWPLLFSLLSTHSQLLYGKIIEASIIYACIYYTGVYFLLRILTKNLLWSVGGMSIILYVHLFLRNFSTPFFWETPSSTLLRAPFDIWFFIAFALTRTAKNKFWHYVMAICTGFALLFGFDTGMYLFLILILYYFYSIFLKIRKSPLQVKDELQTSIISLGLIFVIIMSGLFLIGKSTLLTGEFWSGILEGIREYGSGISNLPFALLRQNTTIIFFEIIVIVYLIGVANLFLKWLYRQNTFDDEFVFALSLYGLARLLIFLSRSHSLNIFHPSIPFWILIFWTSAKINKSLVTFIQNKWVGDLRQSNLIHFVIPSGVFVIGASILVLSSLFQQYPNIFSYSTYKTTGGLCLLNEQKDVCGLSIENRAEIDKFTQVILWMQQVKSKQQQIAIFDDRDTLFYLATDNAPWFRYRPGEVFTKKQLKQIHEQILNKRPQYVIMEEYTQAKNDVWTQTRVLLTQHYHLTNIVSGYGIWVLN